jgi:hypothetical protein
VTHDDVQAWLDRYTDAWLTYDSAKVERLFSPEAEYRYHPWDDPVSGRDAIVEDWLRPAGSEANRDKAGTVLAHYAPYVVDGDRAVVVGETIYYADATQAVETRHYWNSWQLRFDADGRCREFVEWYMQRKKG